MHIQFERSGGFTGIPLATSLDSETLSPEEVDALQKELDQARFFDLPAKIQTPGTGADRFEYRITVEKEGRSHTIEVGEGSIPETLQPLVQHLTTLARSARQP